MRLAAVLGLALLYSTGVLGQTVGHCPGGSLCMNDLGTVTLPLHSTDTTYWCQNPAGCGPSDHIVQVTAGEIAAFGSSNNVTVSPPLTMSGNNISITIPNAPLLGGTSGNFVPVTVGSGLALSGGVLSAPGGGGGGSGTVSSGTGPAIAQYQAGVSTVVVPAAMSGDCTIAQGGAVTCTKTGGVALGTFATQSVPALTPLLGSTGTALTPVAVGSGLTLSGGTLSATGGGGGGGTPAGPPNAVQFNSSGSFGGTAVVNNAVLVTSGSGVPSESATLPSGLTIPGYLTGATVSGDAAGSGSGSPTTAIPLVLTTVNSSPGTYRNATVTVDAKGRSTTVAAAVPFGTPASSSAACTQGDSLFDATYVYTCVATNTWHRVANGATW